MKPLFELERNNINTDWRVVKIKRVLAIPITDGPHETPELLEDGVPFLSAEAVKKGKLNFNLKRGYISREDHEKYIKKCKPQRDDVFMVKSGATTGNVAMVETDEEFSIWSPLALIRANTELVLPKYLYYFIDSVAFREQVEVSWSYGTQQNIGMKVIENLFISLPPLEIQGKLVDYIIYKVKDIDELIERKETLIELLEQHRQSIITEVVTKGLNPNVKMKDSGVEWIGEIPVHWEISKIKYQADINKNTLAETTDSLYEMQYIDIGSVNSKGELSTLEKYRFSDAPSRARRKVKKGDTIVSTVRTYLKAISTIESEDENLVCSTGFAVLTARKKIREKYLSYLFKSTIYVDEIVSRSTGVSYPAINASEIGNLECLLPSLEEQKEIEIYIEKRLLEIDKIVKIIIKQIEKLKEYRQSIIYEAVTGKIDVRKLELD